MTTTTLATTTTISPEDPEDPSSPSVPESEPSTTLAEPTTTTLATTTTTLPTTTTTLAPTTTTAASATTTTILASTVSSAEAGVVATGETGQSDPNSVSVLGATNDGSVVDGGEAAALAAPGNGGINWLLVAGLLAGALVLAGLGVGTYAYYNRPPPLIDIRDESYY